MNRDLQLKIYAKNEQVKLIDVILEGLCVKELNHDGRKFLKQMRENLKIEIEVLAKPLSDDNLATSKITNSSYSQNIR